MGMVCTYGEILVRISPQDSGERIKSTDLFRITAAGSELNVAVALANLGMDTRCASVLSNDSVGEKLVRKIRENHVGIGSIKRAVGENGIFWSENGVGVRASNVIYYRTNSLFSNTELDNAFFRKALAGASWLHITGITPAVSKTACDNLTRCLDIAGELDIPVSVDLNYRKKLWRWAPTKEAVLDVYNQICERVTIICGNESDCQECLNAQGDDFDSIAQDILNRYPNLSHIALSDRKSYSASENDLSGHLFTREGDYTSRTYELHDIRDRVGTGDSFAAGIIYGLNNFSDDQKTVDFATALAALNHTTIGDFSTFTADEVQDVLDTNGNGRIQR